ncbi:synaptogenesis protein syg-2-like [Antedon mediterranea]|uniref:synaptogenesis protein syg-2-like n=1 Tax=Antedon mediterranea TaxID=105859 RepID=UPI003AF52D50
MLYDYVLRWGLVLMYYNLLVDGLTTIHPTEMQVLVGDNATFECSTSGIRDTTRWWWFKTSSHDITLIANEEGYFDVRYKLNIDVDRRKSTLTILNITVEDGKAQYYCQQGSVSMNATLIVITGTKLDTTYPECQSDNSVVNTKKTLTLTCSASGGNPRPLLQWYRNGTKVTEQDQNQNSENELSYSAVLSRLLTVDDETAIFTCKAEGIAATVNQSCSIKPAIPPTVIIIANTTYFADGDSLDFTCKVMTPWNITHFIWMIDNQLVTLSTSSKNDGSVLTIFDLDQTYNIIRCNVTTASGLVGNDDVEINYVGLDKMDDDSTATNLTLALCLSVATFLVGFIIGSLVTFRKTRKSHCVNEPQPESKQPAENTNLGLSSSVDKPYYHETIISSEQIVSSETDYSELTPTTPSIYSELNEPKVQKK